MARAHSRVATTDRYRLGKKVESEHTKSGFRIDYSQPRDENDTLLCKKGETYWWWKFRYGGKIFSATQPKPSQLTQSEYYSTAYAICESIEEMEASHFDDEGSIESWLEDIKGQVEELRDQQQEKLDNMPESLQDSPTGELLQERYDACEEWYNELEALDIPDISDENISENLCLDDEEDLDEEERAEKIQEERNEMIIDFLQTVADITLE